MKNFIIIFLIIVVETVSAQSFYGGFRGGFVGSQVQGDNLAGFKKFGGTAGFLVGFPIDEFSNFQTELLFVQKGSRKNPTNNNPAKYAMKLNYVEMPFLYRRQLKKEFGVEAGLSFGVLLKNHDVEYDLYGQVPSRQNFKSYELAANIGLTLMLDEKNRFNLRCSHSLMPIRPHQNNVTYYFNNGQYNFLLALTYERIFR